MAVRQAMRMTMISQHFYNSAFSYFAMLSLPDHATQFCLQGKESLNLGFDIRQHVARHTIDAFAGLIGAVGKMKKFPNGVEGKAQFPGVANESESPGVGLFIAPLAAGTAQWSRHKAFLLIKPDGLDFGGRSGCQIPYR